MPAMGCLLCLIVARVFLLACSFPFSRGFDCDFKDPNCGWTWSDGFSLVMAQNSSLGKTAPSTDAHNNAEGSYLYYTAESLGKEMRVEVTSPEFKPGTKPSCYLEFYLHMYNMDQTEFKMVIEAPNVTLESGSFEGNSRHKWEKHKEMIGSIEQPFHVFLEAMAKSSVYPSHLAIDDIRVVDCYDTKIEASVECGVRQFQCSDRICLDADQVCDVTVDCVEGEDENQQCDVLPEAAYCTFETGTCGWNSSKTDNSTWVRHSGVSPNKRTGPSFDHTFQNNTGVYLLAKFPSGRSFTYRTILRSPLFNPPPLYHSDKFSKYFNSCQVRFYYHKYGQDVGELRLYSVEVESRSAKTKFVQLWRSFGNKGDVWRKTVVSLPPITRKFYLEFSASRGVRHSDISIDDVTLSMECFCRGIPENETSCITTEAPDVITSPRTPLTNVKNYTFGTCGARGRFGPKPEECAEAYKDTSVQVDVGTEPELQGIQTWTVPADGIYTLFLRGAGGGIGDGNHLRSRGSSIRVSFQWKKGEVIRILVGQKGGSACSLTLGTCSHQYNITKSSLFSRKKSRNDSSGGGGGGATVVYKVDESNFSKILLAVAAGGGGLSAKKQTNPLQILNPNGMGINSSVESGSGFSGDGAGGGGGWNGTTVLPSGGQSLQEGGRGGVVCPKLQSWATDGGFGGGGGACAGGGGGGGYRGGDASEIDHQLMNGQGGTSYVNPRGRLVFVEPGVNEGDGSAIIVPTQEGCGCEHLCVLLDLDNQTFHCVCPEGHAPGADGFSCEALIVTEMQGDERGISTRHLVVIILCVVVAVGVLLFFTVLGLNRYRKQQSRDLSHEPLSNPEMQLSRLRPGGGMVTEDNPIYRFGGSPCTVQDLRKVPREHLTLVKALGQGAFGEVYQGYLTDASDNSEKPVAVKTLPELSSSQSEMDFLMEALIMSKFNHPNIVSFIGVCFEKMPHFIVLELLPGGDLKSFLRECRPKPQKSSPLTLTDLLLLAMDVAKGCEYLEENHFIHRDIAARNCLLSTKDRDRVVKIADFGMARDIYRADYYRKGGKAMLPVKWMPPEAFLDGIFTSKTDVWSFGVLLWEVISLGYMPYPGRGNQEVMQLVTSGGRLEPPTNCPSPVYHIMMKCWHPLPDQRPNFFTIIERLGYCLQDPDVINAPLPVFTRPPSMERDATVMRPPDADNGGCLRVHRPDPGLLLSPGSEDYLIPMPQSTYSMTTDRTDLQSSPSLGSVDQLLELEDRSTDVSPSKPPEWGETNFMTSDTTTDLSANPLDSSVAEWNGIDSPPPQSSPDQSSSHYGQPLKKRAGGYTEVPTEEEAPSLPSSNDLNNPGKRGMPTSGIKMMANRVSSIKSLDALPVALEVVNENEVGKLKTPSTASTNHSNLSLDPGALSRQLGSNPPTRYMNIDVNCNSGGGGMGGSNSLSSTRIGSFDQNVANQNVGPFDGYAGVNPVA